MSKRKQRLTIWDLGRLETTPLKREDSVGTLKQYRERLAREEQQAEAAKQSLLDAATAETSRLMRECLSVSAEEMTRFWSQAIDQLKTRLHDSRAFDELFLEKDSADVDSNETYDKVYAFLNDMPWLESEDERRFSLYVAVQVLNDVVVNPESLKVMFDRCLSLGIFKGNVPVETPAPTRPVQKEEPVQLSTMQDLMNVDAETRDGQRRARNIADELYIEEFLPIATEWVSSLQENFNFSPTSEDMVRVSEWIQRNNRSRIDPRTYDEARRWMVSAGYWPETYLTNLERFHREIESVDTSRMTHEQRRSLTLRERHARQADLARFGR